MVRWPVMVQKGMALLVGVWFLAACGSGDGQGLTKHGSTGGTSATDSGASSGGGHSSGGSGGASSLVLCASDKTCTPLHQLCDRAAGHCVDCLSDADCQGTAACRRGACQPHVACKNSLDCTTAPGFRQICDTAISDCVECVSNADCNPGLTCVDLRCSATSPGGQGGTFGAGGSEAGGSFGAGGVFGAGGLFGAGGSFNTGGVFGAGGLFGTGGSFITGGTFGAGGISNAGGAIGGTPCSSAAACQSHTCAGGVCQPPTCEDGVTDGGETSADCGGPCSVCRVGASCTTGTTCSSGVCTVSSGSSTGTCAASSTCSDGAKDGTETDVDCGGLACSKCGAGKSCRTPGDCNTHVCTAGLCATCDATMCPPVLYPPCCTSAGACSTLGQITICI